jgi:hypothetical protein
MQSVQFHAARLARRREFLSASDAAAYDRGARAQQAGQPCPITTTPEMTGWIDSEMAELDRLEHAEGMAQ